MKKSNKKRQNRSVRNRTVFFRLGMLALLLFAVGMVTAIAKYRARSAEPAAANPQATATNKPAPNFVTIEMNGKKLQVDAQTLQQGPLTQTQAQQVADALKDNKSTDGLVQVQNPDGSVSTDLQGRFQNVLMARKNDDGTVSQACVDNPEAAAAFLNSKQKPAAEPGAGRSKTVAPAKAVAEQ